jgi:GTP cyclohydrolase II
VRLLTNNPAKCEALQAREIEVTERVPLVIPANPTNSGYLRTKAARMGHLLHTASRDEQAEPET